MAGVAAHGLDQSRDEIVAMLQLDVDVREGRRAALVQGHQAVVGRPGERHGKRDSARADHQYDFHANAPSSRLQP